MASWRNTGAIWRRPDGVLLDTRPWWIRWRRCVSRLTKLLFFILAVIALIVFYDVSWALVTFSQLA